MLDTKLIKKIIYKVVVLSLVASCINLKPCNDKVIGKYYSYSNPKAKNLLILKKDSTFYHYYKENNIKLIDSGKWNFNDKYCYIEFSEWKNFNEKGLKFEIFGNYILYVNGNHLDITPDGEDIKSFIKESK